MNTSIRIVLLIALLAISGRAHAQSVVPPEDTRGELGLMFWKPTPVLVVSSGDLDTDVDFVNDIGIEKERFREFRLTLRLARKHKVRFSYVPVHYEEQGKVLQRTVVFNGVTYQVNVPVDAELNWDLYRFGYEWDALSMRRGFIGLVTEVKYNKVSASLTSPLGGGTSEATAPVPTIGGIGRGYLTEYVSITGEFTALKIDRDNFFGKMYDFDLYGQINLNRSIGVQIGYRSISVDYLVDADAGNLELKGMYVGGVVRF